MRVKIAKWGNSLAVRIPKRVIDAARLKEGQEFEIEAEGSLVSLRPATPRYDLEDMVAEMRRLGPGAEPDLVDWGPDRGSEILPEDDYTLSGEAALRPRRS